MKHIKLYEQFVNEGTYNNDREIAIYDGEDGLTYIEKRGKGYYGYNDEFDFEAKDKAELEKKLKSWGYKLISGSIDETVQEKENLKRYGNELWNRGGTDDRKGLLNKTFGYELKTEDLVELPWSELPSEIRTKLVEIKG